MRRATEATIWYRPVVLGPRGERAGEVLDGAEHQHPRARSSILDLPDDLGAMCEA
jgi:hypothetical protein